MKELSNWGRWGNDDELGAANLITAARRKQALALAAEGLPISLAHDVPQERAADAPNILERTLGPVNPGGTADRYQYTGTYHGIVHSHLDSLDCHMMVDGKGYNGVAMEDITAAGGCPNGSINALKDGVVTRAILFDATLLPGKATAQAARAIAIDAQNNIYVADSGNKRIQVFDSNGGFKCEIRNVGAPQALCITPGPNQVLYSSNSNPRAISIPRARSTS